jgi:hypothetical protein
MRPGPLTMTRHWTAFIALAIGIAAAQATLAQSVNECEPEKAQQPVGKGRVVLSDYEATLIWRSSDDPAFTLWTLANYAAPILWFSPDEPLLRAGANLPQPLPPRTGTSLPNPPSHVYYNIPLVVIRDEPRCSPLVGSVDPEAHPLRDQNLAWNDDPGAPVTLDYPPLDCLDSVKIRFFFYYASDLGVNAHLNDLESLQINIRILRDRDSTGFGPFSDGSSGVCADGGASHHCAMVMGLHGSAHGIAWYTNGLNVDRNLDTILPTTVLVEEGKHASAPDRNSDGRYTPGFDVDIHPNDAWGVRDTLGTSWLQAPAFRADMSKPRIERDRVFPPVPNWRIAETWAVRTIPGAASDPGKAANAAWQRLYELVNIREAVADPEGSRDVKYCDEHADQVSPEIPQTAGCEGDGDCEPLEALFRGEEGCQRTRVLPDKGWLVVERRFARWKIGGPHNEYLTWSRFFAERVAPAFRMSGSAPSIAWTPPVALNVPGLDGWLSARLNLQKTSVDRVSEGIVDAVYSHSAARHFSFYAAIGADKLPSSDADDPGARRAALEGGFKLRGTIPGLNLFAGARVGVRAVDPTRFRYPRLVFEIGGGSW